MNKKFREQLIVVLIALPVLLVMMGGVYSIPAISVTRGRDPWFTLLLGAGLLATVAGIGFACNLRFPVILGAWLCACMALFVRRRFGKLDHNLERFGLIHGMTLVGMFWVVRFAQ
jgi:hypothetical protein